MYLTGVIALSLWKQKHITQLVMFGYLKTDNKVIFATQVQCLRVTVICGVPQCCCILQERHILTTLLSEDICSSYLVVSLGEVTMTLVHFIAVETLLPLGQIRSLQP